MSHKDAERIIGEIFIKEYNNVNSCNFCLDQKYLSTRDEKDFPDLKFSNGEELFAEVVRAVSQEIEKRKNKHDDLELVEVNPFGELFGAIEKKESKHYADSSTIILLIHLPFYSFESEISWLSTSVKSRRYSFKEIWAVWDDRNKKPRKLA